MHKKLSAKIVIVFASILLLAHAVIPHLHFKSEIVITAEAELSHAHHSHHHNPSDPNDKCENNLDSCILKQVFLARSNDLTPEINVVQDFNLPHDIFGIQTISNNTEFRFSIPSVFSPPGIEKPILYSYLFCESISSRGSPLV